MRKFLLMVIFVLMICPAVPVFAGMEAGPDTALTRTEAIIMLISGMGVEEEAAAHPKNHPFSDVP
ncbi:MAG: hypothetical protein LBV08_04625, partial [Clostridiales bacterium]|nr:hypothetical protein [Clostridiales bacterium]